MSDTERPAVADDPQDPLRPEVEDENSAPTPPLADPHQDTEVVEEQPDATADPLADDDDESVLSEIDEAQFEDFDPAAIAIEERPIPVDESNVNSIGKYKRKRAEGEEPKKKKKSKKKRSSRGDDDTFEGGEEVEGRRTKKRKDVGDGTRVRSHAPARQSPDNLDHLTPEERRKRALDKKMDNALRNPNRGRTRKKDEIDLEAAADEYLDQMRRRMAEAAHADLVSRDEGKPAMAKLKMLPEVISILNRNNLRSTIVDSEGGLLEGVRFFLEPLKDGSLPAYNIQRDIFVALSRLPMNKDALAMSGIGKVVMFYTKTKKAEPSIKRAAERLIGEWMRPILKRSDDFRKKTIVQAEYDPIRPVRPAASQPSQVAAAARERALAKPAVYHRPRVDGELPSYTVAPRSNVQMPTTIRRAGDDSFKRLKARQMAAKR